MHVLNREHAEPALTHALECRVREAQKHARRDGRELTTEQALAELDNPPKRDDWKAQIRQILSHNCLGPRIGEHVFALIEHDGTVLGDVQLESAVPQAVLAEIEAAIPGVSPWMWTGEVGGVYGDERFAGSEMVAGLAVRGKRVGFGTWANTEND